MSKSSDKENYLEMSEKKDKARMIQKMKVGKKELSCVVEFDSNTVPETGSSEMFDAIFKSAKNFGGLTKEDEDQVQRDMKKFWGSSLNNHNSKPKKKSKSKSEKCSNNSVVQKLGASKKSSQDYLDTSQDTMDLLRDADALLSDWDGGKKDIPSCSTSKPLVTSTVTSSTRKRGLKQKVISSPKKSTINDIVELSDTEDDYSQRAIGKSVESYTLSDSDEDVKVESNKSSMGKVVMFQVVLKNQRHPIRIYENQTVKDLRSMVAEKSGLEEDFIDMFLGNDVKLENTSTILQSGIKNMCDVDAYFSVRSEKDLFNAGSTSILRLKLQTSDRRGRQNSLVYVSQNSKMQKVVDDYAKEMGLLPSNIKLQFDGEILDLNSTPLDCDLEGDECIDVLICGQ